MATFRGVGGPEGYGRNRRRITEEEKKQFAKQKKNVKRAGRSWSKAWEQEAKLKKRVAEKDRNEILDRVVDGMKDAARRMTLGGEKGIYREFGLPPADEGRYQVIHWGDRVEVGLCFDGDPVANHRESEKFKQIFNDEIKRGDVCVHTPNKKNIYIIKTVPTAKRTTSDIAQEAVEWMLWFIERCEEDEIDEL